MHATRSRRMPLLLATVALTVITLALWLRQGPGVADTGWATAAPELQGILWPVAHPVAPFRMRTQHGDAFDAGDLRGQWNFVFFGYLQCPDVCPTTLQSLRDFRRQLLAADPAASSHRFVFVSVDPGNDTAARVGPYLAYFDSDFIGLLGSAEELAGLARSLAAMYAEYRDQRGRRSMDHTTSVMVVDPAGRVVAALPAPHDPVVMRQRFLALQRHFDR